LKFYLVYLQKINFKLKNLLLEEHPVIKRSGMDSDFHLRKDLARRHRTGPQIFSMRQLTSPLYGYKLVGSCRRPHAWCQYLCVRACSFVWAACSRN